MRKRNRTSTGIIIVFAAILVGAGGCSHKYQRSASYALANPEQTTVGGQVQAAEKKQPQGQSGFSLLYSGYDAFVARAVFIDAAQRTIDAQYFIFEDDVIGSLMLERFFAASDRGVRVRLLIDDWFQADRYKWLAGIAVHPNIEVRVFNPVGGRFQFLRQFQYFFGSKRLARRMHNKVFIVDNSIAFVGGRDIADPYFSAREDLNYHDMDLMAVGPVVRQVSISFDQFWNDSLSVPIEAFASAKQAAVYEKRIKDKFAADRELNLESQYIKKLKDSRLLNQLNAGELDLTWAASKYVCDPPGKVTARDSRTLADTAKEVENIMDSAQNELLLISPYLVPGKSGIARFNRIRSEAVTVKVLTNSLASTDYITTYGGLEWYRKALLASGVQLYEIKPVPGRTPTQQGTAPMATLHTKCVIADANTVYVGSMNLDRRSPDLDTQDGIIVYGGKFGSQAAEFFAKSISPAYSYRIITDGKKAEAIWVEVKDGRTIYYYDEPDAGFWRRFAGWLSECFIPEWWL